MALSMGTPIAVDAAGSQSGSTSVSIPAGTTCLLAIWHGYNPERDSVGCSFTLGGASLTVPLDVVTTGDAKPGYGLAYRHDPATGSQTFAWDYLEGGATEEGGRIYLLPWSSDTGVARYRASAGDHETTNPPNVSAIASGITDGVVGCGQSYTGFSPALTETGGVTTIVNDAAYNSQVYEIATVNSPGASTTQMGMSGNYYSSLVVASVSEEEGTPPPAEMEAAATAEASATAALTTAIQMAASAVAVATVTATLLAGTNLASDAASVSSATANLTTAIQMAAAPAATATATGVLVDWGLVTVASPDTGPGSLFDSRWWSGTPPADGDFIAYEDRGDGFETLPNGHYSAPVYGSWLVQFAYAASPTAWTISTVELLQTDFVADAYGVSTATAGLTTSIPLAADAAGVASVTAALSTGVADLAAAAQGVSTASASLTTSILLAAGAAGVASAAGSLTTGISLAAGATGISTATATLAGTSAVAPGVPRYYPRYGVGIPLVGGLAYFPGKGVKVPI